MSGTNLIEPENGLIPPRESTFGKFHAHVFLVFSTVLVTTGLITFGNNIIAMQCGSECL